MLFSFIIMLQILTKLKSQTRNIKLDELASKITYEIPESDPTSITFRGTGILTTEIAKAAQGKIKIIIEEGITEIGDNAFYRPYSPSDEQMFAYENIELPRSLERIGKHAFDTDLRTLQSVHFPNFNHQANENEDLESFYSLRTIDSFAFYKQKLSSHNIPATFTLLGSDAFDECELDHIEFGSKITNIPNYCFCNTLLEEIVLPSSITSISSNSFMNCKKLAKVTWLASEVTTFGYACFYGCTSLEEFVFPPVGSGFQSSGEHFGVCTSLKRCVLPETISNGELSAAVFYGCTNLKEVVFPTGIQTISRRFFMNSGIETMFLPESVATINSQAFQGCLNLKYVHVANKGTVSFEQNAFASCNSIELMVIDGNLIQLQSNVFVGNVVCYNGLQNPIAFSGFIDTDKTTLYLTEEFREQNKDVNFGYYERHFEGFPYEIQTGNVCSIPDNDPSSDSNKPSSDSNDPSSDSNEPSSDSNDSSSDSEIFDSTIIMTAITPEIDNENNANDNKKAVIAISVIVPILVVGLVILIVIMVLRNKKEKSLSEKSIIDTSMI